MSTEPLSPRPPSSLRELESLRIARKAEKRPSPLVPVAVAMGAKYHFRQDLISKVIPAAHGCAALVGVAMKAGYRHTFETTNESVRIKF